MRFTTITIALFFFCPLLLSFAQENPQVSWTHVATYDSGFAAPYDFQLLLDDTSQPTSVLAIDPFSSDQVLARIRLADASPIGSTVVSGEGPGELSGEEVKISQFSDGGFLVWDSGQRRAYVYDSDIHFQGQVRGISGFPGDLFLVNDSTVAMASFSPDSSIFTLHRLREDNGAYQITDRSVATVDVSDSPALEQSDIDDNVMLRQGPHHTTQNGAFFGFTYGSLVLKLTEEGLRWATTDPPEHALPLYDYRDGYTVSAPDVTEHPLGVLDVTGDDQYLYVLYSGRKIDRAGLFATMTGAIQRRLEEIRHSGRLYVLDQDTGRVVADTELPTRARSISVAGDYLGLLTHEGDEPAFEIYELPQEW